MRTFVWMSLVVCSVLAPAVGRAMELRHSVSFLEGLSRDGMEVSRARFTLESEALQSVDHDLSFRAKGRAFYDPAIWPNSKYPSRVRRDEGYDLSLRELSIEWKPLPWTLRLGTQSVVWGEALHYFSADVLHPKDYRDGFLNTLEWARRPQTGVFASADFDRWNLQFVYFPISQVNRYPRAGAEFSVARYSPEAFGITDYKDESLWKVSEPTIGVNGGLKLGSFELHGILAWLRDPQYFLSLEPSGALRRHDQIFQAALTASYAYEEFLIRLEELWTPRRTLNGVVAGALKNHDTGELNSIGSIEWSGVDNVIFSLQGYWNQRYHCEGSQILPCRTLQEGIKVLWMNLPWNLEFESTLWVEANDPSFWWSNHLRKSLGQNARLEVMVEEFFGSGSGLFAEWNNRDQIWTRLEFVF